MPENNVDIAIGALLKQIEDMERKTLPLKQAVNTLCEVQGLPARFADLNATFGGNAGGLNIGADQFFNRPLAGCVAEYLEQRKQSNSSAGPATVDDIFAALVQGGYRNFESANEDNSRRAIKISLTKNTAQFVKIGEDKFGLKRWYGMRTTTPRKASDKSSGSSETTPTSQQPDLVPSDDHIDSNPETDSGNDVAEETHNEVDTSSVHQD